MPFQLEHAFSSAVLLYILSVFLPPSVPKSQWRKAVTFIFKIIIAKGSVVAGLRTVELEHLETLLSHYGSPEQPVRPQDSYLQSSSSSYEGRVNSRDPGLSQNDNRQSPHGFISGRDDRRGDVNIFNITSDDILALAQEFEHDDPSTWVILDERG